MSKEPVLLVFLICLGYSLFKAVIKCIAEKKVIFAIHYKIVCIFLPTDHGMFLPDLFTCTYRSIILCTAQILPAIFSNRRLQFLKGIKHKKKGAFNNAVW